MIPGKYFTRIFLSVMLPVKAKARLRWITLVAMNKMIEGKSINSGIFL